MNYTDAQIKDIILGELYMEKAPVYVSEILNLHKIAIDPKQLELILYFLQAKGLIYGQYKQKDWQIGIFEKGKAFCETMSFHDDKKPIKLTVART